MSDVITEKEAEISPDLKMLIKAKELSDKKQYIRKNALLRELMHKSPQDFTVSEAANHGIVGVTHLPTDFKIHTLERNLPALLKVALDLALSIKQAGKEKLVKLVTGLGKEESLLAREEANASKNIGRAAAAEGRAFKPPVERDYTKLDRKAENRFDPGRPDWTKIQGSPQPAAAFVPKTAPAAQPSVPFTAARPNATPSAPAQPAMATPPRSYPAQTRPAEVAAPRPAAPEAPRPVAEAPKSAPAEVNDPLGIEEFKRENLNLPASVAGANIKANPALQALGSTGKAVWNVASHPYDSVFEHLPIINKYVRDPVNQLSRKYLLDPVYNSVIEPFNKMYKSVGNKVIDRILPTDRSVPAVFNKPKPMFETAQTSPPLLSTEGVADRAKGVANTAGNYAQYGGDLLARPFESATRAGPAGVVDDAFRLANTGAKGVLNASTAVPYHLANYIRPRSLSSAVTKGITGATAYNYLPKAYNAALSGYNEIMDLQRPEENKSNTDKLKGSVESGVASGSKEMLAESAKRLGNSAVKSIVEPINNLNMFPRMSGNVFQTNQDPATNAFYQTMAGAAIPGVQQVLAEQTGINPVENPAHAYRATTPYGYALHTAGKMFGKDNTEALSRSQLTRNFQGNLADEFDKLPMSTWLQNPMVKNVASRLGDSTIKDVVTGEKALQAAKSVPLVGGAVGNVMGRIGADKVIDKRVRDPLNKKIDDTRYKMRNFAATGKLIPPEVAERLRTQLGEDAYQEIEKTTESEFRHGVSKILRNTSLDTNTGKLNATLELANILREAEAGYMAKLQDAGAGYLNQEGNIIPRENAERLGRVLGPDFQKKENIAEDVLQSSGIRAKAEPIIYKGLSPEKQKEVDKMRAFRKGQQTTAGK